MAFTLTEEQKAFRDTLRRSFSDLCTSEFLRTHARESDSRMWEVINSLGLFEYFADADAASAVDLALVGFEAGNALLPTPVGHTLFFGPYATTRYPQYRDLVGGKGVDISGVQAGTVKVTSAVRIGEDRAAFISDRSAGGLVLIPPRLSSALAFCHATSISEMARHECLDITRASYGATVEDPTEIVGAEDLKFELMVMTAAELAGVAAKVVAMTKEYTLTRKQFGTAIGSFQAVQQQLADAYLKAEASWALAQFAAECIDADRAQLPLAALTALRYATREVPACVEAAIQLHGGIGFTWEFDLHLYLRRAQTLASLHSVGEDDQASILNHVNA